MGQDLTRIKNFLGQINCQQILNNSDINMKRQIAEKSRTAHHAPTYCFTDNCLSPCGVAPLMPFSHSWKLHDLLALFEREVYDPIFLQSLL